MNIPFYEIIVAIVLGIIQGVSEFLPISSTAHVLLASNILSGGYDVGLNASNFIQFGTLIAILVFYRKDISHVWHNIMINLTNFRQFQRFLDTSKQWLSGSLPEHLHEKDWYDIILAQLIIATIPLIVAALSLRHIIEGLRGDVRNIAFFLILGGVLISIGEFVYAKVHSSHSLALIDDTHTKKSPFTLKQVLCIGIFQCFAVFPGVSRSGSTLAGALLTGRNRKEGVYFSFLLSIPAILLVSLYDSIDLIGEFVHNTLSFFPVSRSLDYTSATSFSLSVISLILAFIVSYMVGIACLSWLLKYLSQHDSRVFIVYRVIIAAIILFYWYMIR